MALNRRPSYSGSGAAPVSKGKRENKLKSFFEGIKNKRQERKNLAAKKISNNNSANENRIIEVLEEIDFSKSRLDPQLLEFRTFSTQVYGDLEKAKHDIINAIVSNNNYSDLNLKDFDTKLYEIACEYRNAINNGHKNAAFASKSALYIAVNDIRNQLPFIPDSWKNNYLRECTEYLDKWIQLIENCISLDATTISLENSDRELNNKLDDIQETRRKYAEDLKSDKDTKIALNKVLDLPIKDTLNDPVLKEIYTTLIENKIKEDTARFDIQMNNMQRRRNQMYATQVDVIRKNVQNLPIPSDPLSFQKFQDSVKQMIADIDKIDHQYEEFIQFMFKLDGELDRLENSQATKLEQKMAADQIGKIVNTLNDINKTGAFEKMSERELMEKLGVKEEEKEENIEVQAQEQEEEEEELITN